MRTLSAHHRTKAKRESRKLAIYDDSKEPYSQNFKLPTFSRQTSIAMSDNGEVEVETPNGYQVLPKEVTEEIGAVKLFNKWSYEDVEIRDISLT